MAKWSKLKKTIEELFLPELDLVIHCVPYSIHGPYGSMRYPRYFVMLGKEIIWDFPKDFEIRNVEPGYWAGNTNISELIREYIDTPIEEIFGKNFEYENLIIETSPWSKSDSQKISIPYRLTELFIAADRRLGKQKLIKWAQILQSDKVNKILNNRFHLN